jgi:SAM-dependent methyltransferase
MTDPMRLKHLDLGCGTRPKNPFQHEELYGVDIRADIAGTATGAQIASANLSVSPIPFENDLFDSVSAYDFFEHIPRVALNSADQTSRFPFIELMNEVWRVLKPGGILYAVTPAYPREKAFRDPTHVNIITNKTYRYFAEPDLAARMYGFHGSFRLIRQCWVHPRGAYEPVRMGPLQRLKRWGERLTGQQSHLLWEFEAIKQHAGSLK